MKDDLRKDFKDEIRETKETGYQKLKEAQKLIKQVPIRCPHQYTNKDKQALVPMKDGSGKVQCKRCGEAFSLKQHKAQDISEAVEILHDVINQIKVCSSPKNDDDKGLVESLGKQDFLNVDLISVYDRIVNDYSQGEKKKKKKKKKNHNELGRYGSIR